MKMFDSSIAERSRRDRIPLNVVTFGYTTRKIGALWSRASPAERGPCGLVCLCVAFRSDDADEDIDDEDIEEDLHQTLGKKLIQNSKEKLDFNWFSTNFYLSPWWDQVYNFGWHFYREQSPWCQHLYFRNEICKHV